jgi:hypothetical protein
MNAHILTIFIGQIESEEYGFYMTAELSKFYVLYSFYRAHITAHECAHASVIRHLNTEWTLSEQQRKLRSKCSEIEKGGGKKTF